MQPLITMQVHQYSENLPVCNNAVVTIGTFDGVHRGHRQILQQLKDEAKAINGETVLITFHPHPRNIVQHAQGEVKLINTIAERIDLLAGEGIDHVVIVPFTQSFSMMSADEYVENFLIRDFHPHTVIIGYDHRFGHGRQGDYHLMEFYNQRGYFNLKEISAELIDDNAVSSTRIRQSLLQGEIGAANHLLGYTYFFEGTVVHGNKLGRELGYPTANIRIEESEKIIPADGIYAVRCKLRGSDTVMQGMMSIGIRPTIDGKERVIEVNIFDFDQDIYGQTIRVYMEEYLRPELRFENLSLLVEQMARDKQDSLRILGS